MHRGPDRGESACARARSRVAIRGGAVAVPVLVGLLLAGCTSGSTAETSPDSTSNGAGQDGAGSIEDASPPSTDVPIDHDTPFTPYLAALSSVVSVAAETLGVAERERFEQVEEFKSACMRDQGFEYVPLEYVPQDDVASFSPEDALYLPRLPENRAEVERLGYGVEVDDPLEAFTPTPAEERNLEIYDALTDAGRASYDAALVGHHAEDSEESAQDHFENSCAGRAESQYPEPAADAPEVGLLEQYGDLISTLTRVRFQDLFQDERTVALNEEWNTCMREDGYELAWPEYGLTDPDPFAAFDLAIRTPVGGVAGEPQPDTPIEDIPLDERTLVGSHEERVIALADFDCRSSTEYQSRLTTILLDIEERFVAAHDAELAELLAAVELIER